MFVRWIATTFALATIAGSCTDPEPSASEPSGGETLCGEILCNGSEYCDQRFDYCYDYEDFGAQAGSCLPRPAAPCDATEDLRCGCDGVVYANACTAAAAGVDLSLYGGCEPPAGEFSCGFQFCGLATSICREGHSDQPMFIPNSYECRSFPA